MSFRIGFFFSYSISVKNKMGFFFYWDCIKSVNGFWRAVIFTVFGVCSPGTVACSFVVVAVVVLCLYLVWLLE